MLDNSDSGGVHIHLFSPFVTVVICHDAGGCDPDLASQAWKSAKANETTAERIVRCSVRLEDSGLQWAGCPKAPKYYSQVYYSYS